MIRVVLQQQANLQHVLYVKIHIFVCVTTCPVLPCFAAMWRAELPWASTASMRTEFRMRNSQAITLPDKMLWWIAALLSSLLFLQRHFKIGDLHRNYTAILNPRPEQQPGTSQVGCALQQLWNEEGSVNNSRMKASVSPEEEQLRREESAPITRRHPAHLALPVRALLVAVQLHARHMVLA